MRKYMIFYREMDMRYFLFNGTWIMAIDGGDPWGEHPRDAVLTEAQVERDVPVLNEIMNSSKRSFSVDKKRYRITSRDTMLSE